MAKIIIPGSKVVGVSREFEIEVGDLVLLVLNSHHMYGKRKAASFGVFPEHQREGSLWLDPKYILKPAEELGGVMIHMFYPPTHNNPVKLSQIKELYVGQDKIVEALGSWEGYKPHADIVSMMEKPYLRGAFVD